MTTSGDPERGGTCPPDALCRAAAEGSVGLQRDLADETLARLEHAEDRRRRIRLASHYAAVRAVDQFGEMHPNGEAALDPVYEGVGRTFEVLTDLDDRVDDAVVGTVETAATVSERLTRCVLHPWVPLD